MIQKLSVRSSPVTGDILSPRTPDVGAFLTPSTSETKPLFLEPSTPVRYLSLELELVVVVELLVTVLELLDVVLLLVLVDVELDDYGGGGVLVFLILPYRGRLLTLPSLPSVLLLSITNS